MPKERLREAVEGGRSVFVGTADADGVPSCCRGIAVTTKDDFETVTVYVPAATAQETMANLATTRRMAVCCSEPLSHRTIQIKGVTRGVKLASPADEKMVRQRWEEFEEVLDAIGLPRRVTHRIAHWPAFAIEMSVEQIFEQTPGPKAGVPLA